LNEKNVAGCSSTIIDTNLTMSAFFHCVFNSAKFKQYFFWVELQPSMTSCATNVVQASVLGFFWMYRQTT